MRPKSIIMTLILAAAATGHAGPNPKAADGVDARALNALTAMAGFLRQQHQFRVQTRIESDYVMPDGQKVEATSHGDLRVRRPDRVRASVSSDRKAREMYYDGKTFTLYAPRVGFYARVAAPPTISGLADMLEGRYGLELPMVDLFRIGSDQNGLAKITSAVYVGPATLDGVITDQYAFRQPGLDWQIWIDRGPRPLPRRIVLTTTDDKSRPQRTIAMRWDLSARSGDETFTFVPPPDSKRITLAETPKRSSGVASKEKR